MPTLDRTLSGVYFLNEGDTLLTTNGYSSAVVLGTSGADTFQTSANGGTFEFSSFNGFAGDDRLIIKDVDTVGFGNLYNGGAGVDTLELTTNTRIVMTNSADISATAGGTNIAFDSNGTTVGNLGVTQVERYIIKASEFNDVLSGSAGNDFLDGRGGTDTFNGSAGNDGYVFDNINERVVGEQANGGNDSIWTSVSVDLRQNANVENLRMTGSDNIAGTGSDGKNLITGNEGDNVITGGAGNDTLWGKGGVDTFVFAEAGSANKDFVYDFGSDDFIKLDQSQGAFAGLTSNGGTLDPADLSINKAVGFDAQLVYNKATGVLSYDSNGAAAGGSQDIAFIGANLNLQADHILLA